MEQYLLGLIYCVGFIMEVRMSFLKYLLWLLLIVQVTACAGSNPMSSSRAIPAPVSSTITKQGEAPAVVSVINSARKMLGVPYRYGGASPSGFDCSGLVSYAYRSAGISIPRSSAAQYLRAEKIPLSDLQPGDLLFFRLSPPKISHVAIYDRGGRFIHAPSSGKRVSYASLDNPYWYKHLVGAGRF